MWLMIQKEFLEYLNNPKFILTFLITVLLVFISVFNGYTTYDAERNAVVSGKSLALDDASGLENYETLGQQGIRAVREPGKLSIFDIGVSGVLGRRSTVNISSRPIMGSSRYSTDPVLAVFGELDLTFVVSIILSLFALLFSYNAVSGEREQGTLRQIMANSVKRPHLILAKLIGGYIPLALTFLLPFLLSLLLLAFVFDVSFSANEWLRLALMVTSSLLYLLVFFSIGLAMSALTHKSFVSFLLCLFVWVLCVAVIPRLAVQSAYQLNASYSIDEIDSRIVTFRRSVMLKTGLYMKEYFDEHPTNMMQLNTEMGKAQQYMGRRFAEDMRDFNDAMQNEIMSMRKNLMNAAVNYSRISPSSCYTLSMHSLANTGPGSIESLENDLLRYRKMFTDYIDSREPAKPSTMLEMVSRMGITFGTSADGNVSITVLPQHEQPKLDLSEVPRFTLSEPSLNESFVAVLPDMAVQLFVVLLFFTIAFIAFLRYDVR